MVSSFDEWLSQLEKLSLIFKKYGSFLPEQLALLQRVHEKLTNSQKRVWVFVAPPASGKTHVICLLAKVFSEASQNTAIVVPNNYLKHEFERERSEIYGGLENVDILNISEYLKSDKRYDYVLVDEVHNLKSSLELDSRVVRSVDIASEEEHFDLVSRHLPPGKSFAAQQLSFPSAKELLDQLARLPKFRGYLNPILKDPTAWKCFVYIWEDSCSLKFVSSIECWEFKLPDKHLLMFSASPLTDEELRFYCGITPDVIERAFPVHTTNDWREKQRVYISITDELSTGDKIKFLDSMINEFKFRTLVLFNNNRTCEQAFNSLENDRLFMIPTQSEERVDIYKQFLATKDGVLLTASTVFWEGITIKDPKLLVIYPPYPRPSITDLEKGKVITDKRDIRRLDQGLGRIGRRKGEGGVGITLFDFSRIGFLDSIKGKQFKIRTWECFPLLQKLMAHLASVS